MKNLNFSEYLNKVKLSLKEKLKELNKLSNNSNILNDIPTS